MPQRSSCLWTKLTHYLKSLEVLQTVNTAEARKQQSALTVKFGRRTNTTLSFKLESD